MRKVAQIDPEIIWCIAVENASGQVLYRREFTSRASANEYADQLPEHLEWTIFFRLAQRVAA